MRENLLSVFLLAVALAGDGCAAAAIGQVVEREHNKKKEAQGQEAAKKTAAPGASANRKLIDGKWYKKGFVEEPAGSGKYNVIWLPE
ncbi:MAG: hypothetical protein QMD05_06660 [Candidatus Brocadiaceae bacterium]|nr:hypothetical protein [Candidatus Brocadiaceae bacterium]